MPIIWLIIVFASNRGFAAEASYWLCAKQDELGISTYHLEFNFNDKKVISTYHFPAAQKDQWGTPQELDIESFDNFVIWYGHLTNFKPPFISIEINALDLLNHTLYKGVYGTRINPGLARLIDPVGGSESELKCEKGSGA